MIKAVIFDMDGVLTETSHQHFLAWNRLAEELGYILPLEVKDAVRGISRLASLDIVLKAVNADKRFTESEKLVLAEIKNIYYIESIKRFTAEDLSGGARELLELLKENGLKIALASASKNSKFLLRAMEIKQYFDIVVDPAVIQKGKPAPDIFLKAAELLNIAPEDCIGIEDAYAGIESIQRAGMTALGVGDAAVLSNCSIVFDNLQGVYSYFVRLFRE
ncbi:MAG: beta-phosphoglucomutase [Clostridiaceae bacterium]|nr:beta-phosphoglucomutase [Clostridiaceae bacterium]